MILVHVLALCASVVAANFEVGVGIADVTGPSVQVPFAGFMDTDQWGIGILMRPRARAFVWRDSKKVVAFVSVDAAFSERAINREVLANLKKGGIKGEKEIPSEVFTSENVVISMTHSHSGPSGYISASGVQLINFFFLRETFNAMVTGITTAIVRAYNNLEPATTHLTLGHLDHSNINRAPESYKRNPKDEIKKYEELKMGNTDKRFLQLKIVSTETDKPSGIVNWFAVHGNSLHKTNKFVTGDNRGYASYQVEREFNGVDKPAGHGPFVAAFASSNLGDVSPNTDGFKCRDGILKGRKCDAKTATCALNPLDCWGEGPSKNMYDSCAIIGKFQSAKALELIKEAAPMKLTGKIDYRHSYLNMPNLVLKDDNTTLCWPAMGVSAPAGGTDGPELPFLHAGLTDQNINPAIKFLMNKVLYQVLSRPTPEQIKCQHPKPIFFNFDGKITHPYTGYPHVAPIQIVRIGCLFILAVPGEFTTMSGRRLREAVEKELNTHLEKGECEKVYTTIAGLSNSYNGYIATEQEYGAQWYEGASTMYGPKTLNGYIQEFKRLAKDIALGNPSSTSKTPEFPIPDKMIELIPPPKWDKCRDGGTTCFGKIIQDVKKKTYSHGEKVQVSFHGANPRNKLRLGGTYLTLERVLQKGTSGGQDETEVVMTDSDWATKFEWHSDNKAALVDLGCGREIPVIKELIEGGVKIFTQGIKEKQQAYEIALGLLSELNVTRGSINNYFCIPDAVKTTSKATLHLDIPSMKDDVYNLSKAPLKLCYHGDYQIKLGQIPVGFTKCSSTFTVLPKDAKDSKEIDTARTLSFSRWVASLTIVVVGSVFFNF